MSREIEFETLDDVAVQDILDDRSVDVNVTEIRGSFNEDGLTLEGYGLECEDEIDLCDILNLSFDQPVICERRDVENAISSSEYLTLKVSDDRRGQEVKDLQIKLECAYKQNSSMFKIIEKQKAALELLGKPWWTKLLNGEKL